MTKSACTDEEFISLFKTLGSPTEVAKRLGVNVRNIYTRRKALSDKLGVYLPTHSDGRGPVPMTVRNHQGRIDVQIENGIAIVFSDAHFWPGFKTTANRALVTLIKQLKPQVVVCNGDAFDGAMISRFPRPFFDEGKPTVLDELTVCKERLTEVAEAAGSARKIWTLGNHDCLDTETELLTRRGWVTYESIRSDDQVLSINGESAVWTGIDEVVKFPYSGDMVKIDKLRISMAVTPNHRVLLNRFNWKEGNYTTREYCRASELPYSFNIPTAAQIITPGVDIPDDAIALCGWILTDGCIDDYSVSIYQSKLEGRAEIEKVLRVLGLKHSIYERQREVRAVCGRELLKPPMVSAQYRICAEDTKVVLRDWVPEKGHLPAWAFDLDSRQFQILLDALVAGDGCWDGTNPEGKTCCVIYGTEPILSSIQSVAVCHGWRARLAVDKRGDYRLCLTTEPKIRVDKPEVFTEQYDGVVWCLRVPYENFMVRRKGCAYFTGNSRFESRLAANTPEYEGIKGFHLKDHFPEWTPAWSCWVNEDAEIRHRIRSGIHATHNNVMVNHCTTVTGHLHALQVKPYTDGRGIVKYGVDTGTLADIDGPQFVDYLEGRTPAWRSGFAVLTWKDGHLLYPELVMKHDEDHVQFRGHLLHADTGAVQ